MARNDPVSAGSIRRMRPWLARAPREPIARAGSADHRHASSPLGSAPGSSLPVARSCSPTCAAATTSWRRCSCNATRCTAPSGPEEMRPVGGDRVRRRHRRDERQRRLRGRADCRRHRGLRRPHAGRPGRGGAGSAHPGRWRPVPRRAPLGQLGRRPDHRQRRAGTGHLPACGFPGGPRPAERAGAVAGRLGIPYADWPT